MLLLERDLESAFLAVDTFLVAHSPLWFERPFVQSELSWERSHRAVHQWAIGLSDADLQILETQPLALHTAMGEQLSSFASSPAQPILLADLQAQEPAQHGAPGAELDFPQDFGRDIKGRKWHQVRAFADTAESAGLPVLDWCAGKGHLARALAFKWSQPVICLEQDGALCATGARLAARHKLPVLHDHQNVFSKTVQSYFEHPYHAVALHACGGLHLHLLDLCVRHSLPALSLSPCCYHLHLRSCVGENGAASAARLTRSMAAASSALALDSQTVRLAVQETVVAPARIRRRRLREQAWRLGFDLLQRELTGDDRYRSLPSVGPAILNSDFRAFCEFGAEQLGLVVPENTELGRFERAGEERRATVSRLALVRHAFRRALELWLVLDRALYLEENGYRVAVHLFCDKRSSPRNLLIEARAN